MAGKKRPEVTEKDVVGLKYFHKLAPLLARLHDDACQRDKAGNRLLHFDQYVMLVLLFLFNPIVSSLRAIVQASQLKKVQRRLGCQRTSLGSLSEAAKAAGVVFDGVVRLGTRSKADAQPDHPIRLVLVKTTPHVKRGKYRGGSAGPPSDGLLRIATDLLEVPAEIIGLIFQYRWTIELFFRFFKHILGCRHLLSHSQNGIEIQTYCAIIACMLLSLWTGRKPTLRTYEMVCYYFIGLADEEELLAHLAKLKAADG